MGAISAASSKLQAACPSGRENFRSLQAEIGERRANDIVRTALGALYRSYGEKFWRERHGFDVGANMARAFEGFAAGGALDVNVVRRSSEVFEVDVVGCRYAEFYKAIGAAELAFC
jgi:hypothetical protein